MAKKQKKASEEPKAGKKTAKPDVTVDKIKKVARTVKKKGAELATNPAVAEVVAATLVAAAAAMRDPKKARLLAESAADEIRGAGKQVATTAGPLWQIALDVARRSLEAVQGEEAPKKAKSSPKKKKK